MCTCEKSGTAYMFAFQRVTLCKFFLYQLPNAYLLIDCIFIQGNVTVIFFIHIQILNEAFMQEVFKIPTEKLKITLEVLPYISENIKYLVHILKEYNM